MINLGDKVTCTHILEREQLDDNTRYWKRKELPKPKQGIYIGYRYARDGDTIGEYFVGFQTVNIKKVALVVFTETTNPVKVPFKCMKLAV